MGTRAIVKYKGKIIAFTHWDGNPMNLGRDLVSFWNGLKNSLVNYDKPFKFKKDYLLGVCMMYQVDGTKVSEDFQEWEYDIRDDGVYARRIDDDKVWVKLPRIYEFALYNIDKYVSSNGKIKDKKEY